jgi:FH1/FH2 domain-containing protein 3
MDLKQGMEILKANKTFRCILGTLLSIGIFLNGSEVKGFQIEYLAKVPEVKDTVHKHSLLHHLCHMVMEKFADATDLYSEVGKKILTIDKKLIFEFRK